ncbi:LOW QUALITY PROTEIN: fibrinogen-like protein 1 [Pecten maximus]|uniref:LOW QUALITY PROTEIN: fibrinogen-like protein 1 n=1 Tax=Pecten maximus TaxID=6579 RepID=UPI001458C25D|nr:LOW QUALITY PROTEIN: fibrinogen-like protein 1 [Pecten maximus]
MQLYSWLATMQLNELITIRKIFVLFQMFYLVCGGKSSQFTRRLQKSHETYPDSTNDSLLIPNVTSMPKCAVLCHRADCEAFDFDSDRSTCRFLSYNSQPGKSFFINTDVESCQSLPAGNPSGVYNIKISQQLKKRVFCEMESAGGGWTVLQNRFDGSQNFNLKWDDYKNGFGTPHGEYWIGNENIHCLTSSQPYTLRIELSQVSGQQGHAEYETFTVSSEKDFYRLEISGFSGNIPDSFRTHHNSNFSTPDKDYDKRPPVHCASSFKGGWWFSTCFEAYLNGVYGAGFITSSINWKYFPTRDRVGLKTSRMMIRPHPEVSSSASVEYGDSSGGSSGSDGSSG